MSTEQTKIAPGDVVTLKSDDTNQFKMTVGSVTEPHEARHGGIEPEKASVWFVREGRLESVYIQTAALSKIP